MENESKRHVPSTEDCKALVLDVISAQQQLLTRFNDSCRTAGHQRSAGQVNKSWEASIAIQNCLNGIVNHCMTEDQKKWVFDFLSETVEFTKQHLQTPDPSPPELSIALSEILVHIRTVSKDINASIKHQNMSPNLQLELGLSALLEKGIFSAYANDIPGMIIVQATHMPSPAQGQNR
jgi:hypothetical protein